MGFLFYFIEVGFDTKIQVATHAAHTYDFWYAKHSMSTIASKGR